VRKILKHRSLFPNDEAVEKLVYLALRNLEKKWTMPLKGWKAALNQFAILFEERFPSTVERALTHFAWYRLRFRHMFLRTVTPVSERL
jgi:hypothetical protein